MNLQVHPGTKYNTEHIFEAQQIEDFLTFIALRKLGIATDPNNVRACREVINAQLLLGWSGPEPQPSAGHEAPDIFWGCEAPIDSIIDNLSSVERDELNLDEFVYLDDKLNILKAVIFGGKNPGLPILQPVKSWNGDRFAQLADEVSKILARVGQYWSVVKYLNDDHITGRWRILSQRMYTTLEKLDRTMAAQHVANAIPWAPTYIDWEHTYIATDRLTTLKTWMTTTLQTQVVPKMLEMDGMITASTVWNAATKDALRAQLQGLANKVPNIQASIAGLDLDGLRTAFVNGL